MDGFHALHVPFLGKICLLPGQVEVKNKEMLASGIAESSNKVCECLPPHLGKIAFIIQNVE